MLIDCMNICPIDESDIADGSDIDERPDINAGSASTAERDTAEAAEVDSTEICGVLGKLAITIVTGWVIF